MNPFDHELFQRMPELRGLREVFVKTVAALTEVARTGHLIMVCGNGGSAADADHIVGELMKGFLLPRPVPASFRKQLVGTCGEQGQRLAERLQQGIRAVTLTGHPALATAYANDVDPEMIFAQQVYALGREGDALIGLSTSGNAVNVIRAFQVAKTMDIKRIAFTGQEGGELAGWADLCLKVPARETYRVQELHLPLYHALSACLEETLYGA